MKNIATGDVLERIRRLAPSHVTAPFKTVAEWREWQLSEGQKRCEEINRQNRQLRVEKILNRSASSHCTANARFRITRCRTKGSDTR